VTQVCSRALAPRLLEQAPPVQLLSGSGSNAGRPL